MEKYYQIKTSSPELFWNRDPESDALQLSFKVTQMSPLPITPNNYYVFMHRTVDLDPSKFSFDSIFKISMMMAGRLFLCNFFFFSIFLTWNSSFIFFYDFINAENAVISNGPRDGTILITDWKGASFGHIFRPSINSIRKGLDYLQNANPYKTRAVHILNSSHLLQTLFCKIYLIFN